MALGGAARSKAFARALRRCVREDGRLLVVCGPQLEREAGLPVPQGWNIHGTYYPASAMQTRTLFKRMWWEVWAWYAARAAAALRAEPSSGHRAVVDLLSLLGQRCIAVSTTSDGLLRRAAAEAADRGAALFNAQVVELTGNVTTMKCDHPQAPHPNEVFALPELETVQDWRKLDRRKLTQEEVETLRCPMCLSPARPNEQFFDDAQDQLAQSAFADRLVRSATLLLLVGVTQPSALELKLIEATRRNRGEVFRVATGVREADPADPANAGGQTGIREGDSPPAGPADPSRADPLWFIGAGTPLLPPAPAAAAADNELAAEGLYHLLRVAEKVAAEEGAMPEGYQRLSL